MYIQVYNTAKKKIVLMTIIQNRRQKQAMQNTKAKKNTKYMKYSIQNIQLFCTACLSSRQWTSSWSPQLFQHTSTKNSHKDSLGSGGKNVFFLVKVLFGVTLLIDSCMSERCRSVRQTSQQDGCKQYLRQAIAYRFTPI